MGGCLSKKKTVKDDLVLVVGSKEDPPQIEEEKVKEVVSSTTRSRFVRADDSNIREPLTIGPIFNKMQQESEDLGINTADLSQLVLLNTSSNDTISAAAAAAASSSTSLISAADDDEVEMKLKMMKKKKKMRSSSSVGMPISQSTAAAAGKREFRGSVDVGCRSARPSPSPPLRARDDHINSSSSYTGNSKRVIIGERSGRMRSLSPASSSFKSRSSSQVKVKGGGGAATRILSDQQHHCRSLSSSNIGHFSPQRILLPATTRALDLGERRRNFNGDGTTLMEEESLVNPLISMECFIFL